MELRFDGVTKLYGDNKALDSFHYVLTEGIYGLLGPNGAGKSTLMNLMTTNLKPSEGQIRYNGRDIYEMGNEYRGLLGYMPQQQGVYAGYSLERFLWYMATLKGLTKSEAEESIPEIVKRVRLTDCMHKKLGSFSGGMKQRALIAQALIGNPKIIVLDEPTAGLDPKERINVRNLIAEIAIDKIVLIATHVVSDISYISKEILLLKRGRVIDSGTTAQLCERINGRVFEIRTDKKGLGPIQERYKVSSILEREAALLVRVISDEVPQGVHTTTCEPDLEDVYLYYFD